MRSRTVLTILTFLVLGVLTWRLWRWLDQPSTLPFERVRVVVHGSHLSPSTVQALVMPMVNGGFFSLRSDPIVERLSQLPWVQSVSIWRDFPSTLKVEITEKVPIAVWNQTQLVMANGKVFTVPPSQIPPGLIQLQGPPAALAGVLTRYRIWTLALLPTGQGISRLRENARQAWDLTLSNGVVVQVGSVKAAKRLARLVRLYDKIIKLHKQLPKSIDLRYRDGFAIHWK